MADLRPKQPGDPLKIDAATWNALVEMLQTFRLGKGGPGSVGAGLNMLALGAAATGSGNYEARSAYRVTPGWPKACSTVADVADFMATADAVFVNLPELLNSPATHFFASDNCVGIGWHATWTADKKKVYFGVALRLSECVV